MFKKATENCTDYADGFESENEVVDELSLPMSELPAAHTGHGFFDNEFLTAWSNHFSLYVDSYIKNLLQQRWLHRPADQRYVFSTINWSTHHVIVIQPNMEVTILLEAILCNKIM